MSTTETILLVDDTPDNLAVMKKVLQRALPQVEIVTFQKPEEVMDYVRSANVSAAIFDVQMPIMNGIELCEKMKLAEETRHIPGDPGDVARSLLRLQGQGPGCWGRRLPDPPNKADQIFEQSESIKDELRHKLHR